MISTFLLASMFIHVNYVDEGITHNYIANTQILADKRREFTYPVLVKDSSGIPVWSPETVNWLNLTLFPAGVADERYCLNCYGDMYARGGSGVLTFMKKEGGKTIKVFKIYVVPLQSSELDLNPKGTLNQILKKLKIKVKGSLSQEATMRLEEEHPYAVYRTQPNAPITEISFYEKDGDEVKESMMVVDVMALRNKPVWKITTFEKEFCAQVNQK